MHELNSFPSLRIERGAVYDEAAVRLGLGLTEHAMRRARREGLRSARCGLQRFYLGEWVLDWLVGISMTVNKEDVYAS
jgi:hypothetical protein